MTAKGNQNSNFARVGEADSATSPVTLTSQARAPLCDKFGRLIIVIHGRINVAPTVTETPTEEPPTP